MASSNNADTQPCGRIVLQQCMSARVMVQPATEEQEAQYVQIDRGLIIYLCFLKGANQEVVNKMVKAALTARLSESENGKLVSVLDLPGDVLIVPQSTLGGRLKGKAMQYHTNIDKTLGKELYDGFICGCEDMVKSRSQGLECGKTVQHGTYGNKQEVFSVVTNGPFTHILDF